MPMVTVNGTELHYEMRGEGPPVLLIMGFTGDGGHFGALADLLAEEFTVVTYDRRGTGAVRVLLPGKAPRRRSRPMTRALCWMRSAWSPAAVYGSSAGGNFALCMPAGSREDYSKGNRSCKQIAGSLRLGPAPKLGGFRADGVGAAPEPLGFTGFFRLVRSGLGVVSL